MRPSFSLRFMCTTLPTPTAYVRPCFHAGAPPRMRAHATHTAQCIPFARCVQILAGEKPNVTEIGPLTYYFKQQKANVTWDTFNDGDTLTYRQWQYYVPADENTAMLQTMNVTSINVPLMGALNSPQLRVLGGFLNDWLSGIQMGPDST